MGRQRKIARLKDVAAAAGVSLTAVSRYLGGSLTLPHATANKIDAAVRKLNYRPNPHARSLSRGRSNVVGLVIPDIANPFFSRLAAVIEAAVNERGFDLLLCVTLNRPDREFEYLDRLKRNHVEALIFMTNHGGSRELARAINEVQHVVLLDEDVAGTKADKIFCDNEAGGYLATRDLIEAGHIRLAFVGGPKPMLTTRRRLAGYRRAIRESGGPVRSSLESLGPYTIEHGRSAAEALLKMRARATGVFFSSDEILLGGLDVFKQHGVRVPGDISVVTFDDVEPLHLFEPPITAVRQPLEEMARLCVDTVLAEKSSGEGSASVVMPVTLVRRASVVPPAGAKRSGREKAPRTVSAF